MAGYVEVDRSVRVDLVCTFKQADQTLTGDCTGRDSTSVTTSLSGTVNEQKADWQFEFDSGGQKYTMTFSGALEDSGNAMRGRLAAAGQDGPFTAGRQ